MSYLIGSNRCATRFVAGDVDAAQADWDVLADLVGRIAYRVGRYTSAGTSYWPR